MLGGFPYPAHGLSDQLCVARPLSGSIEQDGNTNMAMIVHSHGLRHLTISARAHLGAIRRFFRGVVVVLVAGAAVTAVMAVKTAYFLSHFGY